MIATVLLAIVAFVSNVAPSASADGPTDPTPSASAPPSRTDTPPSSAPSEGPGKADGPPASSAPATDENGLPLPSPPAGDQTQQGQTPDFDKIDRSLYNGFIDYTLPTPMPTKPDVPSDGPPMSMMMPDPQVLHSACTVFAVSPTIMVTARHCVNPAEYPGLLEQIKQMAPGSTTDEVDRKVQVRQTHVKNSNVPDPTVVAVLGFGTLDSADFAILQIDGIKFDSYLSLAKEDPKTGDRVYAIGFPAINLMESDGFDEQAAMRDESYADVLRDTRVRPSHFGMSVSGTQPQRGVGVQEGDSAVQSGQSGGPVVNSEGKVVGIVSKGAGFLGLSTSPNYFVERGDLMRALQMYQVLDRDGNVIEASQPSAADPATSDVPHNGEQAPQGSTAPSGTPVPSSSPAPSPNSASATPTPTPTSANVGPSAVQSLLEIDDHLGGGLAFAIIYGLLVLTAIAVLLVLSFIQSRKRRNDVNTGNTAPLDRQSDDHPTISGGSHRH